MNPLLDIVEYNRIAITYLKAKKPEAAYNLLDRAEKTLKSREIPHNHKLWGVTLNNLGCYYKHIRKPQIALHYFDRASNIRPTSGTDKLNMAGIYLNISSVKDELGQHSSSAAYAHRAIHSMRQILARNTLDIPVHRK